MPYIIPSSLPLPGSLQERFPESARSKATAKRNKYKRYWSYVAGYKQMRCGQAGERCHETSGQWTVAGKGRSRTWRSSPRQRRDWIEAWRARWSPHRLTGCDASGKPGEQGRTYSDNFMCNHSQYYDGPRGKTRRETTLQNNNSSRPSLDRDWIGTNLDRDKSGPAQTGN